jgi:hypothetical protein
MAKAKKKVPTVKLKIGDKIQFYAYRIVAGNPIEGKVTSFDENGVSIVLSHRVEGIVNYWNAGFERGFMYDFIDVKTLKVIK